MLKKLPVQPQLEIFKTVLISIIHPEHELCLLAKKIDWKGLEDEFAPLYGKVKKAIVDRGYKVKGGIADVDIVMLKNLKRESYYLKKMREARCRSRAGIEGLISHLKHDHRMIRNYLSGTAGDQTNTLLAAAAYNMKKWMRLKREAILNLILRWFLQRLNLTPVNIQR